VIERPKAGQQTGVCRPKRVGNLESKKPHASE
jgi:hypothetical protein